MPSRFRSSRYPLILAVLALAGCGVGESAAETPSDSPSTSASASAPSSPTDIAPTDPPASGHGVMTVDGVVGTGVEAGCLVLRSEGAEYLLLGADEDVPMDVPVRVRGVREDNVISYCMQGTPLRVLDMDRR